MPRASFACVVVHVCFGPTVRVVCVSKRMCTWRPMRSMLGVRLYHAHVFGVRCLACARYVFPMSAARGSALCEDHSCYLVGMFRNTWLFCLSNDSYRACGWYVHRLHGSFLALVRAFAGICFRSRRPPRLELVRTWLRQPTREATLRHVACQSLCTLVVWAQWLRKEESTQRVAAAVLGRGRGPAHWRHFDLQAL